MSCIIKYLIKRATTRLVHEPSGSSPVRSETDDISKEPGTIRHSPSPPARNFQPKAETKAVVYAGEKGIQRLSDFESFDELAPKVARISKMWETSFK
jgi:hypothetical protein